MLAWAVIFLIIALIAAVFGFGGIAAASAGIAKLLFVLFLVICVIFLFLRLERRKKNSVTIQHSLKSPVCSCDFVGPLSPIAPA